MKGVLFLIIGPTGVGKNTLINKVTAKCQSIQFSPSYTSRPQREDEAMGRPYFFIDVKGFEKKIQNNELIEWKFVHGNNYYGLGKVEIEDALKNGINIITDVEVLGAIDIIDQFPQNSISVFVDAGSKEELIKRTKQRGSWNKEDLAKRLDRIDFEMLYKDHFDYFISNNDLNKCCTDLINIIESEIILGQYRFEKSPSAILHYIIRAIIINSANEVLLFQKKGITPNIKKQFLNGHVLRNESPKDALLRELHFLCPSISEESKELIYSLTPISEEKHFLGNHNHYEMVFKIKLDLPDIHSENYDFTWISHEQANEVLDEEDSLLIDIPPML